MPVALTRILPVLAGLTLTLELVTPPAPVQVYDCAFPETDSTTDSPGQIAAAVPEIVNDGEGFTIITTVPEAPQPSVVVLDTIYVLVKTGFTIVIDEVDPLLQTQELPPKNVSVTGSPGHTEFVEANTNTLGLGLTVT